VHLGLSEKLAAAVVCVGPGWVHSTEGGGGGASGSARGKGGGGRRGSIFYCPCDLHHSEASVFVVKDEFVGDSEVFNALGEVNVALGRCE